MIIFFFLSFFLSSPSAKVKQLTVTCSFFYLPPFFFIFPRRSEQGEKRHLLGAVRSYVSRQYKHQSTHTHTNKIKFLTSKINVYDAQIRNSTSFFLSNRYSRLRRGNSSSRYIGHNGHTFRIKELQVWLARVSMFVSTMDE